MVLVDLAALLAAALLMAGFGGSPLAPGSRMESETPAERAQVAAADLRTWATVLEGVRVDYGKYLETNDVAAAATFLRQGYWDDPSVVDPWGRPYRLRSGTSGYRVWTLGPDGADGTADDMVVSGEAPVPAVQPTVEPERAPSPAALNVARAAGRVGNTLSVTKSSSGRDLVLSWAATGTTYDVVGAAEPRFLNPYYLAQTTATTFTYTGALDSGRSTEWFDVTDENETNSGADSGGYLPPQPPVVDPLPGGSVYAIGQTVNLSGSGFSDLAEDNLVCLAGGICFHPAGVSRSATQLSFPLPPAALTGTLSVGQGTLASFPIVLDVKLETTGPDTVRSVGFAGRPGAPTGAGGEYWVTARHASVEHTYRYFHDSGTGAWVREEHESPFGGDIHFISTKTDRFQNLYAAKGNAATDGGGTRKIATNTNPPGNLQACTWLNGSGEVQVLGAAPDPNPEGSRPDVVYFALRRTSTSTGEVRKVDISGGVCGSILDSNHGGRTWSWPTTLAQVGMSVDEATGDLYVGEATQVLKVTPTEVVTVFKTGFTKIFGLDVWHAPGGSFSALLVADYGPGAGGSGKAQVVPLDNATAAARTVATGTSVKSVAWSRSTFLPST